MTQKNKQLFEKLIKTINKQTEILKQLEEDYDAYCISAWKFNWHNSIAISKQIEEIAKAFDVDIKQDEHSKEIIIDGVKLYQLNH